MKFKKTLIFFGLVLLAGLFGYWYIAQESPVYCFKEGRVIPDSEFLDMALKMREAQIAQYGGIDAYEKHFINLNRHPNEAGRDFDTKNTECCEVHRGVSKVKENCGGSDAPICVSLNFPKLEGPPTYGAWRGRSYLFSACGRLQENY